MSESFDDLIEQAFEHEPSSWELLEFTDRFRYLRPDSRVAELAMELYGEREIAQFEYDQICERVREGYEWDEEDSSELLHLRYGLMHAVHSEKRFKTFTYLYSSITYALQAAESNTSSIDYDETVDQACIGEIEAIRRDGTLSELAQLDLKKLVWEIGTSYHLEPDCVSLSDESS